MFLWLNIIWVTDWTLLFCDCCMLHEKKIMGREKRRQQQRLPIPCFFPLWLWIAWFCLYTVAGSSSNDDSFHRTKLFLFMHKYMHGMSFKSAWLECKTEFYFPFMHMFGSFFSVEILWWETERRCYLDGSGSSSRCSRSFWKFRNWILKLLKAAWNSTCLFTNSLSKNNNNFTSSIDNKYWFSFSK